MRSIFTLTITLLILCTGCCPSPCITSIAVGPTVVEPQGFVEPPVPPETEEFIFFKGKAGNMYNFSLARQSAIEDLYAQIFHSIIQRNHSASPKKIRDMTISGVFITEEHNIKSTTPYRQVKKKGLSSVGVKYEVIVIGRLPKLAFMKAGKP